MYLLNAIGFDPEVRDGGGAGGARGQFWRKTYARS